MGRPRKIVPTPDVLTDGEVVIVEQGRNGPQTRCKKEEMTMGRPRKIVPTPDVLTDGEVVIVEPLDEEEMDMLEDEAPLDGEVVEEVPMSESTRLEMQAGAEAVRRNQAMAALAAAQAEEAKG